MGSTSNALCSVEDFLAEQYDYVVIGGGTAGLCVAARLSENPDVKVGVLEAGENRMDDPAVSTPGLYPTLIGDEKYDWKYNSIPQKFAGNKVMSQPRGKALGGSSAINYLMYVRGSREDYDGWESLGNKGRSVLRSVCIIVDRDLRLGLGLDGPVLPEAPDTRYRRQGVRR